uniref:Uncharacterized protein n=1 Tax=Anopheles funestus TaxID=62324 RepID=A0A182S0R3_ANOFN
MSHISFAIYLVVRKIKVIITCHKTNEEP